MHAAPDSISLAPPQPPGMVRAFGLALLAHALLLVALTWSVNWKQTESATVEAEIWSSIPQQAAPKAVEAPPPPPPPPAEETRPPPKPVEKVQPPPAPEVKDADIALERAKKKREAEKLEQAQQEKLDKAKREKAKIEKDKQDALKAQKAEEEADKKRAEDKRAKEKKAAQEKQAALDAQRDETRRDETRKAQAEAKALAAQREANLKRMAGLAGATGGANATGSALQSAGPSSGYGGRVTAKVRPNIVFPDSIDGNPMADVEVRSAPDGTILSRKLVKSSGNKAWDDAVLKAIDKTETMPRDTDGRVPSPLTIGFRPKD
ncbi:colicin import membrane protein [Rhodoferax ferrireducens]|uniref:Colicin import membrane protein n=1 Tax=Rhodoferax ferrireducens TaxID=192843 RepID=A0ABU2C7Y0_9BURK|nr:cell envelope integrity protein TolA [Rhodoferax ferrireducens]MDR7377389.1 colicin import membrane protein [Rhodoferax ferrireducens]